MDVNVATRKNHKRTNVLRKRTTKKQKNYKLGVGGKNK
jgi:hypothetical protein